MWKEEALWITTECRGWQVNVYLEKRILQIKRLKHFIRHWFLSSWRKLWGPIRYCKVFKHFLTEHSERQERKTSGKTAAWADAQSSHGLWGGGKLQVRPAEGLPRAQPCSISWPRMSDYTVMRMCQTKTKGAKFQLWPSAKLKHEG